MLPYCEAGNLDYEALIEEYTPLVKKIAHHLCGRMPSCVQVEDLIQSGMMGLIEAAQKFDAQQGASFETFAGIRIRGSMLDDIRRGDWVPRSVHRYSREIADAISKLEGELGSYPSDMQVAEALDMTIDEYHRVLADVNNSRLISSEELAVPLELAMSQELKSDDYKDPQKRALKEQFLEKLADGIDSLAQNERLVLSLYYVEELNLKETGTVIGVTESRVSQLHGGAIGKLRKMFEGWAPK